MSDFVQLQRTSLDAEGIREALIFGHIAQYGVEPSPQRLAVGWAQVSHETGGGRAIWNFNLCNMKGCSQMPGRGYPTCVDIHSQLPPGSSEPRYQRAYPDAVAGAADYWRLLGNANYSRHRVLEAFDEGDPVKAAKRMRAGGFYQDTFDRYSRAMRRWHAKYTERWPLPPNGIGSGGNWRALGALVVLMAGFFAWTLRAGRVTRA